MKALRGGGPGASQYSPGESAELQLGWPYPALSPSTQRMESVFTPRGLWQPREGLGVQGTPEKAALGARSARVSPTGASPCGSGRVCTAHPALHSCPPHLAALATFPSLLGACGPSAPSPDPVLTAHRAPGVNSGSQFSCHCRVGGSGRIRIPCRRGGGARIKRCRLGRSLGTLPSRARPLHRFQAPRGPGVSYSGPSLAPAGAQAGTSHLHSLRRDAAPARREPWGLSPAWESGEGAGTAGGWGGGRRAGARATAPHSPFPGPGSHPGDWPWDWGLGLHEDHHGVTHTPPVGGRSTPCRVNP